MSVGGIIRITALVWMTAAAAAQPPHSAGALVDEFAHAWNTHDGPAFGRLYADDADWVTAGGERLKGRRLIEAALAKEHAGWARVTVLSATDVAVRDLDRERAIVMFKWEIASKGDVGARPTRGNTLLVVTKDAKRWVIIAGQVATVPTSR